MQQRPSTHGTEERQLREEDLTRKRETHFALRPLLAALRFRVCDVVRTRSEKAERPGDGARAEPGGQGRGPERLGLRRDSGSVRRQRGDGQGLTAEGGCSQEMKRRPAP